MPNDLLLEVGTEELPASFIEPALEDLQRVILERASAARLSFGEVKTYGTPRRLAVAVRAVADRGEDHSREVLGPPTKAAFDREGNPTRAAEKFAQGWGLSVNALKRVQTPKGEYLAAQVVEQGRSASELLPEILHAAVHGINFRKSMRWGDVEVAFARPVHWVVALLGQEVLPVVLGDVKSGRTTRGHRFLSPGPIELRSLDDYEAALQRGSVIADIDKRRGLLLSRVKEAAAQAGGSVISDDSLIDQVVHLVELPCPLVGTFDARHLDLPPEVLIQEMKSHQRYFSLVDEQGRLLPKFIAVSNTPVHDPQVSVRGYERVLRARLADGRFFFDQDRKTPLIERTQQLHRVVWQGKLGNYAEKVDRFRALAVWLARQAGRASHLATIERAATLAKADLVTGMVGEFPELQGVMGREYARADGEPSEVALAIYEHYLPRFSTDQLPTEDPGALIGLADRLDTLCGIFAIGKIPSGAADPFALRRACLAVIHLTIGRQYRYRLSEAVDEALKLIQPKVADLKRKPADPPVREQVLEFFRGRLKAMWGERYRADAVEAVLAAGFDDLVAAQRRVQALAEMVGRADFGLLATAFKRVVNIVEKQGKDVERGMVEASRLIEPAEKALHHELQLARERVAAWVARDDFGGALSAMADLKPSVDTFFDQVMVMAEDKGLRDNRIRLLIDIGNLFNQVADFSKIQVEAA